MRKKKNKDFPDVLRIAVLSDENLKERIQNSNFKFNMDLRQHNLK